HVNALLPRLEVEVRGNGVAAEEHHASIGDDSIQSAKARFDFTDSVLDLCFIRDVDLDGQSISAGPGDLVCDVARGVQIDVKHSDAGAFFREFQGHSAPDPRTSTGDNGFLTEQSLTHPFLRLSLIPAPRSLGLNRFCARRQTRSASARCCAIASLAAAGFPDSRHSRM